MSETKLDDYLSLPYRVEVTPDEEGEGYNAEIRALKGCMAFGKTVEEAYDELQGVKRVWLETALERGWRIPEPPALDETSYSGQFRVRLPSYLHRDLVRLAEDEGTSLNQLVVALLSEGVGRLHSGVTMGDRRSLPAIPVQSAYAASPVASEKGPAYDAEEDVD